MEQTIATSIFENDFSLQPATHWQRLTNYIIDLISFIFLVIIFFFAMSVLSPDTLRSITFSPATDYAHRLILMLSFALYMGTIETISQGRTIGKLITGTRAVNEDGTNISAGKAFLRGIIRAIPCSSLSGLSKVCTPWHDQWTNTYVIDIDKSRLPTDKK
ncbi:RDD family protein [Chitinophaga sp.]|uniref:RDD family protein n=1 Tax=Chitinophaga sp. TaxID=1869181 RepID=UPI002F94A8A7